MSKKTQIKSVKGMNDILPLESPLWLAVEDACRNVFENHGFRQLRTPIVESTNLFLRSIGTETDIVSKEMYTFDDRNSESLTLRPEGTASCVRAGIQNGLFYNQQQKLWYTGPMFRYEKPQKGRYRQFHQIGVETYGWSTPDIEAQVLSMVKQVFERLGLLETHLEINSLGDADARADFRAKLVDYLSDYTDQLDEDSLRRLKTNPLRILDSKNSQVQAVLEKAPSILDCLSETSNEKFSQLQAHLQDLGIEYKINPRLVRGLDYYNDTVFEWINADFGAQSTVCAGGRYDNMVEQLGGQSTAGFGFGMGLERLIQILQEQNAPITQDNYVSDVFIISVGDLARRQAVMLQQSLTCSNIKVECFSGNGSMKNQFKKADKSGAAIALIIGEDEADKGQVAIKPLRYVEGDGSAQQTIMQNDALNAVTNLLESL